MTSVEVIAIIGAVVAGLLALVSPILAYLTLKATKETAQGVEEVHQVVNSKNDALVTKVSNLEKRIAELMEDKRDAKESLALKAVKEAGTK